MVQVSLVCLLIRITTGIKGKACWSISSDANLEDDGAGNAYTINDAFRSTPSYYESLQDYSRQTGNGRATPLVTRMQQQLTGVYATDTRATMQNLAGISLETYEAAHEKRTKTRCA